MTEFLEESSSELQKAFDHSLNFRILQDELRASSGRMVGEISNLFAKANRVCGSQAEFESNVKSECCYNIIVPSLAGFETSSVDTSELRTPPNLHDIKSAVDIP